MFFRLKYWTRLAILCDWLPSFIRSRSNPDELETKQNGGDSGRMLMPAQAMNATIRINLQQGALQNAGVYTEGDIFVWIVHVIKMAVQMRDRRYDSLPWYFSGECDWAMDNFIKDHSRFSSLQRGLERSSWRQIM